MTLWVVVSVGGKGGVGGGGTYLHSWQWGCIFWWWLVLIGGCMWRFVLTAHYMGSGLGCWQRSMVY